MNCIYLKQKLNRKLECKKDNKRNIPNDCRNCKDKCLNYQKCTKLQKKYTFQEKKSPKMYNKSAKLKKLERNRESLFTNDMDHCFLCHSKRNDLHEIFGGRNRINSMKYGLILPLCRNCHSRYQNDKNFNDYWHKKGQAAFEEIYPDLKFIDIFKRNY